jgi:DNA-binding GntR family transcriptional regulator
MDKVTAQDIQELRRLAREFEQSFERGDRASARGINYRLHRRLYEFAGMPQTLHFVQILWARYPFDLINAVHGRGGDAAQEHEAILLALTGGDAAAAILAMRHHIESGFGVLQVAAAAAPHTG